MSSPVRAGMWASSSRRAAPTRDHRGRARLQPCRTEHRKDAASAAEDNVGTDGTYPSFYDQQVLSPTSQKNW